MNSTEKLLVQQAYKYQTGGLRVVRRDIQNVLEVINQMGNVRRYSRDFLVKPESNLEHTGFVVMFCYIVGKRLEGHGHTIDWQRLMQRATVHDIEEVLTGDVPRPTKYATPEVQKAFKVVARNALDHLCMVLKIYMVEEWLQAKARGDLEGRLVKVADMAAVVYKTMTEVSMYGNQSFLRVSEEITVVMDEMLADHAAHHNEMELYWVVKELSDILLRVRNGDINFGSFFKGA